MTTIQLLSLLLALSAALHTGCAAAFIAWRGGTSPAQSLLLGGGAAGAASALYFAAISAYR
ncbi:hypothetical protein AB0N81_34595 [Streptomyces sp. NPDC093510]|uniref:hypothetical protein n=1 Tax=Streptomyces sp. NPDC093510 TaxID=3155199 RepID=UPI00341A8032